MTVTGIPAAGPGGVLRLTWVRDRLAGVLEHCGTDDIRHLDRPGLRRSWPGRGRRRRHRDRAAVVCPRPARRPDPRSPAGLTAEHGQLFRAAIQAYHAGQAEAAGQLRDKARAVWARTWAANLAALGLMQVAGLTRFSPVKPQRWGAASFEHHGGPHGLLSPHITTLSFWT